MLALRLPKDIEDRLTALAKKTGRTKSFYSREAILEHLEDLEDAYEALEGIKKKDSVRITLAEVMDELELDENSNFDKTAVE